MRFEGVEGVETGLHDAFLTISTARISGNRFTIKGYAVLPAGRFDYGRYAVELSVSPATAFEVADDACVDQIDVHEIAAQPGSVTLEGKMPVRLTIYSSEPHIVGTIDPKPFAIRRWLRWRQTS